MNDDRMLKKAVQQGRSERKGESYSLPYVEPLSDARTLPADFFSILPGRLLSRREILRYLGATGATWLLAGNASHQRATAGIVAPSCIVRPEQTEGPYFIDERLNRSDIRSDPADGSVKPGTILTLTFQVTRLDAEGCHPLQNVQVDLWHCDAQGLYSDVRDPYANTIGRKFLRGYQLTDVRGEARFITIYPGWYPGRTVHIHFKIRTAPVAGRHFDFTSQLYFNDDLTDRVHTAAPYATAGPRMARNRHDGIFWRGGKHLVLDPKPTAEGYATTFPIALQLP